MDRKIKFEPKQAVRYISQCAAGIDMKKTVVIGLQDTHENLWIKRFCNVAKSYKPRKVNPGTGKVENRYVIQHYFGWYHSNQKNMNPELNLNINRRYHFAYESELTAING